MLKAFKLTTFSRSLYQPIIYNFISIMDDLQYEILSGRLLQAESKLTELESLRREITSIKLELSSYANMRRRTNDVLDNGGFFSDCAAAKKPKLSFQVEDGYTTVYTDGACENNGKKGAKAGIGVWFDDNHACNVAKPVIGRATNNTAEIQACIEAIEVALKHNVTQLKIYTDSQFVISSITQWIKRWKKNSWKVASGGDVKNKEDFQKLDAMCARLQGIKWEHVNGHVGIHGNEEADKLARQGALRYKA